MWIVVLFDLPVSTERTRKAYARFRKALIEDGYGMMQYSVYYRHCVSRENMNVHVQRVRNWVPPDGEVRILQFTDKQFSMMEVYRGKRYSPVEDAPAQLEMF
ncbi:MAG: CRISPR-associated endonuclease Cas2 [Verrucomicrobiota bacterium]